MYRPVRTGYSTEAVLKQMRANLSLVQAVSMCLKQVRKCSTRALKYTARFQLPVTSSQHVLDVIDVTVSLVLKLELKVAEWRFGSEA